ncbi:MAG: hypothetical protein FWG64_03455 [Firmicutes bacterium]|nr:hypothetical protein [Bacillota bacterium]
MTLILSAYKLQIGKLSACKAINWRIISAPTKNAKNAKNAKILYKFNYKLALQKNFTTPKNYDKIYK